MIGHCIDISVSGVAWTAPPEAFELQPAYRIPEERPPDRIERFTSYLTQEPQLFPSTTPEKTGEAQVWGWRRNPTIGFAIITEMIDVEKTDAREVGLQNFRDVFETLPVVKRAQLFRALSRINGYLVDIEASDDGEIIIETKEDGRDCFYAICTREGDFKGTWLSQGILKKESWSASLPYELHALRLT
jgi:hypothetical protein